MVRAFDVDVEIARKDELEWWSQCDNADLCIVLLSEKYLSSQTCEGTITISLTYIT